MTQAVNRSAVCAVLCGEWDLRGNSREEVTPEPELGGRAGTLEGCVSQTSDPGSQICTPPSGLLPEPHTSPPITDLIFLFTSVYVFFFTQLF